MRLLSNHDRVCSSSISYILPKQPSNQSGTLLRIPFRIILIVDIRGTETNSKTVIPFKVIHQAPGHMPHYVNNVLVHSSHHCANVITVEVTSKLISRLLHLCHSLGYRFLNACMFCQSNSRIFATLANNHAGSVSGPIHWPCKFCWTISVISR